LDELARFAAGDDDVCVSISKIYQWRDHLDYCRITRGKAREDLVGVDQMLLVLFLAAYPEA
jgi:hypothetical protein